MRNRAGIVTFIAFIMVAVFAFRPAPQPEPILEYVVDPSKADLRMYWKDESNTQLRNFSALEKHLSEQSRTLLFAMNGGMYKEDRSPVGLYVDKGLQLSSLNTAKGKGNFYMQPNGVFYITSAKLAGVCTTNDYKNTRNVRYATQSGPMLITDGEINSAFTPGSKNLNIRNGVGILPDSTVLLAMSTVEINFYDFAKFFRDKGCRNALYLDGFVSRCYFPAKGFTGEGGDFGVMIGVSRKK
jgi:uncharacterized protein YigE (DUF2233 family)